MGLGRSLIMPGNSAAAGAARYPRQERRKPDRCGAIIARMFGSVWKSFLTSTRPRGERQDPRGKPAPRARPQECRAEGLRSRLASRRGIPATGSAEASARGPSDVAGGRLAIGTNRRRGGDSARDRLDRIGRLEGAGLVRSSSSAVVGAGARHLGHGQVELGTGPPVAYARAWQAGGPPADVGESPRTGPLGGEPTGSVGVRKPV